MGIIWLLLLPPAMAICLAAIIGALWQYPPLLIPLLFLVWRTMRGMQVRAHRNITM